MEKIIIKRADGGTSILQPSSKHDFTLDAAAQRDVDEWDRTSPSPAVSWRRTSSDNVPTDKEFRNAWTDDNPGETVDVDISKAKVIQTDRIRASRDAKWPDFDKRYLIAEHDSADLTTLNTERQTLKDIPNNAQIDIDSATDVAALKAAWPSELS